MVGGSCKPKKNLMALGSRVFPTIATSMDFAASAYWQHGAPLLKVHAQVRIIFRQAAEEADLSRSIRPGAL